LTTIWGSPEVGWFFIFASDAPLCFTYFALLIFYLKHSKVCRERQDNSGGIYSYRKKYCLNPLETLNYRLLL
jgi:hypothetical protein